MSTDRELQRVLAFRVTTDELRRLVRDELPELFPALPSGTSPPAHVVSELFRLADNHGCSRELRALLWRRWPGLFGEVRDLGRSHHAPPSSLSSRVFPLALVALSQPQTSEAASSSSALVEPAASPDERVLPHDPGGPVEHITPEPADSTSETGGAESGAPDTTGGQPAPGGETSGGFTTRRRRSPPRLLASVRSDVERALRACTDGEEWDLEIVVAADHRGRWSTAYGEGLSAQMNRCVDEALQKVMKRHGSTQYQAGASQTLVVRLR